MKINTKRINQRIPLKKYGRNYRKARHTISEKKIDIKNGENKTES